MPIDAGLRDDLIVLSRAINADPELAYQGGTANNVIPEYAEAVFGLRARDMETLGTMIATFTEIAEGAAKMTVAHDSALITIDALVDTALRLAGPPR
ncbi:MAG: hypothetical protein HY071_01145 [Chloroflexi bacterium]|nr:hypothetical protein [Chloroflexota bacterium]